MNSALVQAVRWMVAIFVVAAMVAAFGATPNTQGAAAQRQLGGLAGFCEDTPIDAGLCSLPDSGKQIEAKNVVGTTYTILKSNAGLTLDLPKGQAKGNVELVYELKRFKDAGGKQWCHDRVELAISLEGRFDEFEFLGLRGAQQRAFAGTYTIDVKVSAINPDEFFQCFFPVSRIERQFQAYVTDQPGFKLPGPVGFEDYFILLYKQGALPSEEASLRQGVLGGGLIAGFAGSGGALGGTDPDPIAPRITLVTMPPTMVLGEKSDYEVDFEDLDKDVTTLILEPIYFSEEFNRWFNLAETHGYRTVIDAAARGAKGKAKGSIPIGTICFKPGKFKMKFILKDARGNSSEPVEVPLQCNAASSPAKGTGATSGWTSFWRSDSLGSLNLFQLEGNQLGGTFNDGKGFLQGIVSEDGASFSGSWYQDPSLKAPDDAGTFAFTLGGDGNAFTGSWTSGRGTNPIEATRATVPTSEEACGFKLGSGILAKWRSLDGEGGFLGCPIVDEDEAPRSPQGTSGRWAEFAGGDGGYIVWHRDGALAGRSFEVHGCIFKLYKSQGGTGSWLGFPLSDEYDVSGGRRSDFEGGYIVWDAQTRICRALPYDAPSNHPPLAPTLLSPPNEIAPIELDPNSDYEVDLRWRDNGDPDGDPVAFWINVYTLDFFSEEWELLLEEEVDGTAYAFGEEDGLIDFGCYSWRVYAVDWAKRSDPWFVPSEWSTFCTVLLGVFADSSAPIDTIPEDRPPPGAVSSVEAALDENGNGVLDDDEILEAIQRWILGTPVPGAGAAIDDAAMRRLVQMWIVGEQIAR